MLVDVHGNLVVSNDPVAARVAMWFVETNGLTQIVSVLRLSTTHPGHMTAIQHYYKYLPEKRRVCVSVHELLHELKRFNRE